MQEWLHSGMGKPVVDGSTRLVGLIGRDVSLSRSFAMHNAAFAQAGLNWSYLPLPVASHEALGDALRGMKAMGFAGANVTMPYKEAVLGHVASQDAEVRRAGAANTLVAGPEGWSARNSDVPGFIAALERNSIRWRGRPALVLGAGGAAKAVMSALAGDPGHRLYILNRTHARAEELVAGMERSCGPCSMQALASLEGWECPEDALVVNCTPDGLGILAGAGGLRFGRGHSVVDLVYRRTPLLERAEAEGAEAMDGMEMLVQQAALSFHWWTGSEAPVESMRTAAGRV